MRFTGTFTTLISSLLLTACVTGTHPRDPYEAINRKTHAFNMAVDKVILKPAAIIYKTLLPAPIRMGINNIYSNVTMLPTVANDLLQADTNAAIKDTWRFVINSTLGIGGVFDAASHCQLPPHSNDLGLTFAKWGDKTSPYIVIPFLGPSTIRDGMGMMLDYALFTPYPYIPSSYAIYTILGIRYVDLRSQMLETDRLIAESLDQYAFIRDAYLQHRQYLITGEQLEETGSLYVEEERPSTPTVKPPLKTEKPNFPLTTN